MIYVISINILSAIVVVYDKLASKYLKKHRVKESYFIVMSILGGALLMWLMMQLIRHKTKHRLMQNIIRISLIIQIGILFIIFNKSGYH